VGDMCCRCMGDILVVLELLLGVIVNDI